MNPVKAMLRPVVHARATWALLGPLAVARGLLPARLRASLAARMPKEVARDLLLRRLPKGSVGAEIGVWKGDFSERILRLVEPAALHLIDPWVFQPQFPQRMYGGRIAASQTDMDGLHGEVVQRFARFPNVHVHRGPSSELLSMLGTERLDWVYIDGNHSREAVALDLRLSWEALRVGGWITGDDYFWVDADGSSPVGEAVDAFARQRGLQVDLIGGQFLLRKPGAAAPGSGAAT